MAYACGWILAAGGERTSRDRRRGLLASSKPERLVARAGRGGGPQRRDFRADTAREAESRTRR